MINPQCSDPEHLVDVAAQVVIEWRKWHDTPEISPSEELIDAIGALDDIFT